MLTTTDTTSPSQEMGMSADHQMIAESAAIHPAAPKNDLQSQQFPIAMYSAPISLNLIEAILQTDRCTIFVVITRAVGIVGLLQAGNPG